MGQNGHMIRRPSRKAIWSLALLLMLSILGGDTLGTGTVPAQAAQPYVFSIYSWHVENFPTGWPHALRSAFGRRQALNDSVPVIRTYFESSATVTSLQDSIARADPGGERSMLERQLEEAVRQHNDHRSTAERAVADMISQELFDQRLTTRIVFKEVLWPPLYFRISEMPSILVVSPRGHIQISETHLLAPEISSAEIERLEQTIDQRGLSSLVEDLGGVATYPSLLPEGVQLQQLLEVASHEWVHHHLYFRPLGRNYWKNGDMTTLNETVADLVGRELGAVLYRKYFESAPKTTTPASAATVAAEVVFDFNAAMRETRVTVERMLTEGKVEEAEEYMEQRRQVLAENGYSIRKLNQAYFAFHGSYAERPGSVSPIGGQVRAIREKSPTL
ncbi:MAG: hypothetical protein HW397_150, partial [Dehalococcoidia bacterium]|nr:hypothetical protein [Dehalococcoidia bacterium]